MKNRYEFKIEDITNVLIQSKSEDKYSNMYSRKYDENGPTREFVRTYNAEPEDLGEGKIRVICTKCDRWNVFNRKDYEDNRFEYLCNHCTDDYEEIVDENELIDIINSIMDKDLFFDSILRINYIYIN